MNKRLRGEKTTSKPDAGLSNLDRLATAVWWHTLDYLFVDELASLFYASRHEQAKMRGYLERAQKIVGVLRGDDGGVDDDDDDIHRRCPNLVWQLVTRHARQVASLEMRADMDDDEAVYGWRTDAIVTRVVQSQTRTLRRVIFSGRYSADLLCTLSLCPQLTEYRPHRRSEVDINPYHRAVLRTVEGARHLTHLDLSHVHQPVVSRLLAPDGCVAPLAYLQLILPTATTLTHMVRFAATLTSLDVKTLANVADCTRIATLLPHLRHLRSLTWHFFSDREEKIRRVVCRSAHVTELHLDALRRTDLITFDMPVLRTFRSSYSHPRVTVDVLAASPALETLMVCSDSMPVDDPDAQAALLDAILRGGGARLRTVDLQDWMLSTETLLGMARHWPALESLQILVENGRVAVQAAVCAAVHMLSHLRRYWVYTRTPTSHDPFSPSHLSAVCAHVDDGGDGGDSKRTPSDNNSTSSSSSSSTAH